MNADSFGLDESEEFFLIFEIRTGRISEGVALSLVFRLKTLFHREVWCIREAPAVADNLVRPFGESFGQLKSKRLYRMTFQVVAFLLKAVCGCSYMSARCHGKERDIIELSFRSDIIGNTAVRKLFLPRKNKRFKDAVFVPGV